MDDKQRETLSPLTGNYRDVVVVDPYRVVLLLGVLVMLGLIIFEAVTR